MADFPRWLDARSAAAYLCLDKEAFLRQVKRGTFPQPTRHMGPRMARWDREALDSQLADAPELEHERIVSQAIHDILTKGRARRPKAISGRQSGRVPVSSMVVKT